MTRQRWWSSIPGEHYWMETTGRLDLGANLLAPQTDERGNENNPGYAFVKIVDDGDIVLHWDTNTKCLVGWSRAVGGHWPGSITWASMPGGASPFDRPAWVRGLEGPFPFPEPVTLEEIRAVGRTIGQIHARLLHEHGDPLYFPFTVYRDWDHLRGTQAYMSKFPAELVSVIPRLAGYLAGSDAGTTIQAGSTPRKNLAPLVVGWDYVPIDEDIRLASPDLYSMDPAVAERGLAGHMRTQNALAAWVRSKGLSPLRPSPTDPLFDLAWQDGARLYVCEVKSITDGNEERQLRLGLGQVLRYRHWLDRTARTVVAVLAPERRPADRSWEALCTELGVRLVWPPDFAGLDA